MSWVDFETSTILSIDPEASREAGLAAAHAGRWELALLRLNLAARHGLRDLELLDALGEAAYRVSAPEALGPYQNHYKYPAIATHMARAFTMLGDRESAREFLGYARECALKDALVAMLSIEGDIHQTIDAVHGVAHKHEVLYYPEYWRALAAVADAAGDEELTRLAERRSKAHAYKDPNIHFNQALRMLGKGEFRAGWRLYDWRLVPGVKSPNRTVLGRIPMWEGETLAGKTLLVYLEQGLGDLIFGLRYLKPLLERGARLEVVARKPLLALVKSSYPGIKVHDEDEVTVSDYWDHTPSPDFWVYAFSVPVRAGLWRPVNTGAFLEVPEELLAEPARLIAEQNPERLPVYTINWHGRIDTSSDRTRAFSVEEFAKVSGVLEKPCFVVSVQKDATEDELGRLEALLRQSGGKFLNAAPHLDDFARTAAWIKSSERLLTCDTSVSHVGGAIGHPTTVLARNKAIWQWLPKEPGKAESGSIWYDSVTIRYALAPEISWLFTAFEDDGKKKAAVTEVKPSRFRFAGREKPKLPKMTPEMKKQFEEQVAMHEMRGNHAAAATIRRFLTSTV
jgi:hypothetical protein